MKVIVVILLLCLSLSLAQNCKRKGAHTCPANECCSQHGYCGITEAHCLVSNNCQYNCKSSSASKVFVAYIPSWTTDYNSPCNLNLNNFNVAKITHLNIPFASFDTTNFILSATNGDDTSGWYSKVQSLKSKNPNLKVLISVGGGGFGGDPWAAMVINANNRAKFINNAISFARNKGFDGIDIDWEVPTSNTQTNNIVSLFSSFHAAINNDTSGKPPLLLTIAAPNYQYAISLFNFPVIQQYLDWINIMSYDYYGPWSTTIGANTAFNGDSSITDTNSAFSGVSASKLVMGFANYARTFTLKSSSQNKPGSPFSGPGNEGSCTQSAGTLSYYEVANFINNNPGTYVFDSASQTPYYYSGNQWITYDNPQSLQVKVNYLLNQGYKGGMMWATDGNSTLSSFVTNALGL